MTNLLQQAINSDDVANYRFPKRAGRKIASCAPNHRRVANLA